MKLINMIPSLVDQFSLNKALVLLILAGNGDY
jgi:hypothetical protein